MVPEREEPLTRGNVEIDVPVEDANLLDAAANGSAIGWRLAVNVGAMLIAFIALIAMVNLGIGWIGGFFRDGTGMVRFNLIALAVLMSITFVGRRGTPRSTPVWWALVFIILLYVGARSILTPFAAGTIGLAAFALWLTLFLLMDRVHAIRAWVPISLTAAVVLLNLAFAGFGPLNPQTALSLQLVLGWLHWPIAFAMGVPVQDCLAVGRLLGEKLVLTEFVAYANLSASMASAARGEIVPLDARSVVLVSYALSGFANFASIAIQIGGIAPLAPSRRKDIARLGLKAMIGGALASYALACVAGVFYTGTSMLGGG
jgi:nucleoside permease NupC